MTDKQQKASDAVRTAREASRRRAETKAAEVVREDPTDRDEAACLQYLVIAMYLVGLKVGMGVMPDGMAVYVRLSVPKEAEDPRAGYVAFVVSDEPRAVLNKAVEALEASVQSNYWKPDRFA